jgi:hypothetical protein
MEGLVAELALARVSVSRRQNFFEYPRQVDLNYKVPRNEQEQTYNPPDKRQHGNIPTDRHAVEKNGPVFIFGNFPPVFKGNVFPFFIGQRGMKEGTDHKSAQFKDKHHSEAGPCRKKQFTIGGGRQGNNLVDKRE